MDSEQLLRQRGLRVTRQRLAVLSVLDDGGHPTVDEIVRRARSQVGSLSTQAVYNVLAMLADAGLARRIEPSGSHARYESRTGDNHHHVVCRGCGRVEDVDCAVGEVPCLRAEQSHGFDIVEAEVTYWGLCPACQDNRELTGAIRPRLGTDG
ncbi:MAG TPA: Fur family transcriptional regulator [Stackebrandtia sp.]|uniref:Fur family transcriptional regulator n=1 Tax=Stackebrandtia sp. TaxID=2023065 RepID=UPI002D63D2C1|nr:Fur family transcriptional regulator [Stackebrandtia sp.]HZE40289.1 Fur family transcriptional regulator [Stackebrandtia sp.]